MPPRTANCPRSSTRSTRSYPASASASASPSTPGSSPTRSSIGAGRASTGGRPSANAVADAQTRPPPASTSSARYRSPTRCGGGASPESSETPRPGRSATRGLPRNQPAASAASRASASSGSRTSRPRPSSSWRAASSNGKIGSETRACDGSARTNAWKRSCARSSLDEGGERRRVDRCDDWVHAVRRGSRPAGSSYWPTPVGSIHASLVVGGGP